MDTQFDKKYWDLPSISLFIERAIDSLRDYKSIVLLLPPIIDIDDFCEKLKYELWKSDFSQHEISLDNIESNLKPLEILNKEFFPDQPTRFPKPVVDIQACSELPDLIVLSNLHRLSQSQLKDWMELLDSWSELAHQNINAGKNVKPMVAVVLANLVIDMLPPRKLFLDYYWWWGFPSSLEVSLLCRSQSNKYFNSDPTNTWKERLLSSLTPGDLNLLEHLWDFSDKRFIDLVDGIRSYAHPTDSSMNMSRLPDKLGRITDLSLVFPGDPPPKGIQHLWSKGEIYATIEYGVEFHPSILLEQNLDGIRHRLWRSQSELLLPIIDGIRVDMCQELTQRLGRDWPYKWDTPIEPDDLKSVKENPAATQLGYIVYLLETNSKFASYRQWLPIARTARSIRNDLAHYRTIDNFENITSFITSTMRRNSRTIES